MRLALILAAVVVLAIPTPASWVEAVYSRQAYLVAQNILTPLSNATRVAVFDLLAAAATLGVFAWWIVALRRSRLGQRWRVVMRLGINTLALLAGIYLVFVLVWGLNYRREPLRAKLDFPSGPSDRAGAE